MRYKIVYDKPGRIRLRLGNGAFTDEEGYGIAHMLYKNEGIVSVETTAINGGILVNYSDINARNFVLEEINGLKYGHIPKGEPSDDDLMREIDNNFQWMIFSVIGKHYLRKWFLPWPVKAGITICQASKYLRAGLQSLLKGKINVSVLDAASVTAAVAQGTFSTASSIMMLLNVSGILEDYTRKKTRAALSSSLSINVDTVWLEKDGNSVQVPVSNIRVGDIICVRSGSVIPLDGEVVDGEALVNESSMTGEPLAVMRTKESSVYAGTVVEEGTLKIRVRALAGNTRIQQIAALIDTSEDLKAQIQSKAEALADLIVPYSFAASILTLAFTRNVTKAISVLMVDYSCAIKLSTPISVISAMREASSYKIMVKGGKYLESFAKADTIIFDKTGTLTEACPKVAKVVPFNGYDGNEVLKTAACLEEHFPHSVAKAIVRKAEEENLRHREEHTEVKYVVAHGIASTLYGESVIIGSRHFVFDDEKTELSAEEEKRIEEESDGYSSVFLAIGGKLAGMLCVEDPVREDAFEVISQLKALGIKHVVMLTGDSDNAAKAACQKLGINEYRAQVLPENKADMVKAFKEMGRTVIMVGDGINDSPALACASVSVAMKEGSDIAREVADITLLSNSLDGLVTMRKLSAAMLRKIQRNYRFIIGFNTMLIVGGMAGIIQPTVSAFLHNVSTMGVSGLSMRYCLNDKNETEK